MINYIKHFITDLGLLIAYGICNAFIMSEMDMNEHYGDEVLSAVSHFHCSIRNHFQKIEPKGSVG
jgi:hypothetical protein